MTDDDLLNAADTDLDDSTGATDTVANSTTGRVGNGPKKRLVLLDGNSLLYRGFFAMRALTTSAGQPVNAVFSFTMMLLTLLSDWKPDVIYCAWDTAHPTFRHEEFKEYKGTRLEMPDDLKPQGPLARQMAEAFHVPGVREPGFEADDIIGTLAKRGKAAGYEVLIVTGDLDALQLVEPDIRVLTTVKGVTDTVTYDEAKVFERYGLTPAQLTDYRALKGDTSDNIPGVPGIGEKTASQLLAQFGTVENLLEHLDEVKPKTRVALEAAREQIALAKRLATIVCDMPLPDVVLPDPKNAHYAPDYDAVRALFEQLEFRMLLRRIPSPHAATSLSTATPATNNRPELEADNYDPFAVTDEDNTQIMAAAAPPVRDIETPEALTEAIEAARQAYRIGLRLNLIGEGILDAHIGGLAITLDDRQGINTVYIPLMPPTTPSETQAAPTPVGDDLGGLFDAPAPVAPTVDQKITALPPMLVALLEDPTVPKTMHDAKTDYAIFARYGVTLRGVTFDTDLAAYLLNAGRRTGYPLYEMAKDYAGKTLPSLDKKERKALSDTDTEAHNKQQACLEADAVIAVQKVQEPRLSADGLMGIFNDLELPVAPILAAMEQVGLLVDTAVMNRMSIELQTRIEAIETQVYEMAGGKFSIGSPKQLQEVLFEKLNLPATKKTKTGYSTDADTLEELAVGYPIVSLVLQWRELSKLKGTYADAMPALVRPDTHRLHTSLNQTVAATGRLSSSNPNLQNIPIRTEIGREIRRAFIAPPGTVLLSADYSQIELRIFAHVSEDKELVAAFSSGEDIHKYTAGKMYNVPVAEVTTDMRRAAKTVNYAVIYGISEFALARRLGISMKAAKELKTSYFERFPGVRQYLDETVAFARDKGYVQTLFGRRRYIPDIASRVFQFRQSAERAASNMPIQGSSADIMKRAMIDVWETMHRRKLQSRLLLQVHDELLFEAPKSEVPELAVCVQECMENAYPLKVALEVEVKTGSTWADVTPVEDNDVVEEGII